MGINRFNLSTLLILSLSSCVSSWMQHLNPLDLSKILVRRAWMQQQLPSSFLVALAPQLLPLAAPPFPVLAASQARVKKQPGIEYLEPIYELQLSIQSLSKALEQASKESDSDRRTAIWSSVKSRLDKFFSGGLLSERNYY